MSKKHVEEAWLSYEREVLIGFSEEQRAEMKRAFHAGAFSTYTTIVRDIKSRRGDACVINDLREEGDDYYENVVKKNAAKAVVHLVRDVTPKGPAN